jgi:hypothetical protein
MGCTVELSPHPIDLNSAIRATRIYDIEICYSVPKPFDEYVVTVIAVGVLSFSGYVSLINISQPAF